MREEETNPTMESARLEALARYDILDTPREAAFDDIAILASRICGVPIALISLLDERRQWFKARVGIDAAQTPREIAFCDRAIRQEGVFEVEDALMDERFATNPLVLGGPRVRFYAGVPLTTSDGHNLGTLCALDTKPRRLSDDQRESLSALARMVIAQMELRRRVASEARRREGLEAVAAQSAEQLARVWNNSQDVMLVIGLDGIVRSANPAATRMLGWSADELVGQRIHEFIHPEDRPPGSDGRLDPLRYREGRVHTNRFRAKSGAERRISWAVTEDRGLVYTYGRDVTEEVEKAAALASAEDRLRQGRKMEALGQLTGGIAHDFNNLLTGIAGSLELLRLRLGQGRFEELGRHVDTARGASKRAAALTHRLLSFSRQRPAEPRAIDANRLVAEMEELITRSAGPAVSLRIAAAEGLWPTRADPGELENALLNLCINARDAMPGGGGIDISTRNHRAAAGADGGGPPGDYVEIRVADTGVGMGAEVLRRAFEPFFTTKPEGQGTGLGLSMIFDFARGAGGHVAIDSKVGEGTAVSIRLPRDQSGGQGEAEAESFAASAWHAGSGQVVLIVDDEATIRGWVAEVLEEAGYQTKQAANGQAALRIVHSAPRIDLIIADVGLPGGMTGRQVADAARAAREQIKVLFITGFADEAAVGEASHAEGEDMLAKPFSMEQLARKVEGLLEG